MFDQFKAWLGKKTAANADILPRRNSDQVGRKEDIGQNPVSEAAIRACLAGIADPETGKNLLEADMVSGITIKDGQVMVALAVTEDRAKAMEPVRKMATEKLRALAGIQQALVILTSEKPAPRLKTPNMTKKSMMAQREAHKKANKETNEEKGQPAKPSGLDAIDKIIAVASGKGGVGKSTTAVNLALALKEQGLKIGLLDADIYGPSLPRMLGVTGRPPSPDGEMMHPLTGHGVKVMSMGFLVPEGQPVIWRGPMVMGAVNQMLRDVAWGELDILVVDLPPGTGDAQLSMVQNSGKNGKLAGAVIVSTPQDIALIDARKGLKMFEKVNVPVLGIVENMSYFRCPHCHEVSDIFGHGGAEAEAKILGCDFLGAVPLHLAIRQTSDAGNPIMLAAPTSAEAQSYRDIGKRVLEGLARLTQQGAPIGQDQKPA